MKTKHLFFTLALSGMFAACTQEELVSNVENNAEALKNRPIAGMVEFSLGDVESRYNHQYAKFNVGESLDLYLMDELNGYYDELDANHMHGHATSVECWKFFPVWSNMYSLVDYAQTRYPFAFNGETWSNEATLLEGNYFAMHPGNEKITNRRDVWRYINPTISLTDEEGNYNKFAGLDNQFWLGYTPIYRDEDRTGDMTLPLNMQPIMTVAKLTIKNVGNTDTKIDKIVFKDKDGKALPTIAYVKPAIMDQEDWRKTEKAENPKTADECGALDCNGLALNTVYDVEKTWNDQAEGRITARGIVHYDNPSERIPYGLEDTEVAYEYVYQFPEDGYLLEGNKQNSTYVQVYIVLPHTEAFTYEPIIYGRQFMSELEGTDKEWAYGILRAKGSDNAIFTLNSIDLDKAVPYVQDVTATFDQTSFEALTEVKVSTTEDLMTMLKASQPSFSHEIGYFFNVKVYGDDLKITDEVVEYLDEKAKAVGSTDTNCKLFLNFTALDRVKTPALVTIDTEKDCMKYFRFSNGSVDVNVAKGEHTIPAYNNNYEDLTVLEGATVTIEGAIKARYVVNEGTLNVEANVESTIENHGVLNIADANIDTVVNETEANVTGSATVSVFVNKNTCVNCGKDAAVLTITGVLNVTDLLDNYNIIVNNGELFTNYDGAEFNNHEGAVINNSGVAKVRNLTNDGTINVLDGVFRTNYQANVNNGTISISEGAELVTERDAVLKNFGIINVEGDLHENVKNAGYIFVKNNGNAVVNGIVDNKPAGIIDVTEGNMESTAYAAKDKTFDNYFRYIVNNEVVSRDLKESLKALISEQNWGGEEDRNPIILVWGEDSPSMFAGTLLEDMNIARVIINNDLVIATADATKTTVKFGTLAPNCNAVDCAADTYQQYKSLLINGSLTVDNNNTLELNDDATVYVAGNFKANNSSKVLGGNQVWGTGVVENYTLDDNFTWERAIAPVAIVITKANWYSNVGE